MSLSVCNLFECPEHLPSVARWIYDEFWAGKDRLTHESLAVLLGEARSPEAIPLSLVALKSGQPIGTVNLIEHDDDQRLGLHPWLAALFVLLEHRRQGVGSLLVRSLQSRANRIGIGSMYLGTDNAGFYQRLGATVHEQVGTGFFIMRLSCNQQP